MVYFVPQLSIFFGNVFKIIKIQGSVTKTKKGPFTSLANILLKCTSNSLTLLMNRRLQDICILMYRVKHKLCPTYICNIFNNHNSSYFLRQSDFSTPSFNTVTYGKHSLRYLGPKLWGKLSPNVRSAETLNIFRKRIRKYDISLLIDDGCKGCSLCSS